MIIINMKRSFMNEVDPARKQELMDSRLIQEDMRAIANLPAEPIHREFDYDRYQSKLRTAFHAAAGGISDNKAHSMHANANIDKLKDYYDGDL